MRKEIASYEEFKGLEKGRSVMVCPADNGDMPPRMCSPGMRPYIDHIYYNAGEVLLTKSGLPNLNEGYPKYYVEEENDGYFHKEAYCLMFYRCKVCGYEEILWNSRDGVTPMFISCKICGKEAAHVNWQNDMRAVNNIPERGSRIFINTPKEIHEISLKLRIDRQWENVKHPP